MLPTAIYLSLLMLWVARGGRVPLWLALAAGAGAAAVAAMAADWGWALLAGAAAVLVLPVLWAERRFPTDCRLCRFFRASLAASSALAVAVLGFPGLIGG